MNLRLTHPFLKAALVAGGILLAAPPAHALFGDDEARQAVLDLRAKVDALQRDILRQLNELSSRQTSLEQRIARLETSQKANLARQNDIDSLRQEIAELRGQLEEQLNQLQTQEQNVDSRFKQFEPQEVTVDGRKFRADQAEKQKFDGAMSQFRKSDFKAADQSFRDFIKAYPNSPYVQTALYWQGGAQYALGNYKTAISTLQSLVDRFPDTPRKADALLLLGNAQADADNSKAARQTFQRISREHPGTPAASSAKERLKTLD